MCVCTSACAFSISVDSMPLCAYTRKCTLVRVRIVSGRVSRRGRYVWQFLRERNVCVSFSGALSLDLTERSPRARLEQGADLVLSHTRVPGGPAL